MFTDLSIDLETLGVKPGVVVTQIGLCAFNARPQSTAQSVTTSTQININPQSCLDLGMKVSFSTIAWWLKQNETARNLMAAADGPTLHVALQRTTDFIRKNCPAADVKVWGNGATFDISLLEAAYQIAGMKEPWMFYNVRDMRTIADVEPCQNIERPRSAIEHSAMEDATAQAEYIKRCVSRIEHPVR